MTPSVLLGGGTGLVGSLVSSRLAGPVVSLVRTARNDRERAIDFEAFVADPTSLAGPGPYDVGISCLGTTIRAAGSQAAFRRVDHDYVVALAKAARAHGARQFILVSSVGAGSGGFYLRVKGETERGVAALGFERLDILRPGLLLGPRTERRPGERLAQLAAPLINPLLRGSLERYAGIPASTVADAIVSLIGKREAGNFVADNRVLRTLAGSAA